MVNVADQSPVPVDEEAKVDVLVVIDDVPQPRADKFRPYEREGRLAIISQHPKGHTIMWDAFGGQQKVEELASRAAPSAAGFSMFVRNSS
jgi:hypothetical protein